MPEIMPPQLAGVQQRPFYVKARSVITAVSILWLILAVAGYGSFSGGTTSLALSLALMYGTGVAILVVAAAVYRLIKRSALRRAESAPQDAAAAAFVDATRFAAEEIRAALSPARPGRAPAASAWSAGAEQRAAAVPVLREPGAPAAVRDAAADLPGPAAQQAPAVGRTPAPKPSPSAAPERAGGTPAAGKAVVGKSVVNKKASAKKKKSAKPRTGQHPAAQGPAVQGKPETGSQDLKRAA
ncbi:MAG: hypothetical protein ABTA24_12280 [Arthrobacter sp.]